MNSLPPFEAIDTDFIRGLVDDEEPEDLRLDYKRQLPMAGQGVDIKQAKLKILQHVCAFANSHGGIILYGIDEKKGKPQKILGVAEDNPELLKNKFADLIRSNTDPPMPGVKTGFVSMSTEKVVFLVYVPPSWRGPHMVTFDKKNELWIRQGANRAKMSMEEIREAVLRAEDIPTRIRRFREDRIDVILGITPPARIESRPKIVLHLIPLTLGLYGEKSMEELPDRYNGDINPMRGSGQFRANFDGVLSYSRIGQTDSCRGYTQVFRNGAIESVDTSLLSEDRKGQDVIEMEIVASTIIECLERYLRVQREMGVDTPVALMLSLIDVQGKYLYGSGLEPWEHSAFDRRNIMVPEILIEDLNTEPDVVLHEAFDRIWQAAGHDRCPCYDEKGLWKK